MQFLTSTTTSTLTCSSTPVAPCRLSHRDVADIASSSSLNRTPLSARARPLRLGRVHAALPHDETSTPSCISRQHLLLTSRAAAAGLCLVAAACTSEPACASGGMLTGDTLEAFTHFLESVEQMGPYGAVLFVTVVAAFEMVPLFPTQPLSLASGLLFGPQKGALLMLLGVTIAAVNAFLISQGVGKPLAKKVIDFEMSHDDAQGSIAKSLAAVQTAIDGGGLWKQFTAITLLRLTPVVPFSASNYVLGLTSIRFPAFLGGTLAGMSVWSVLYASLGGASRSLLDGGAHMDELLADLVDKAASLSSSVLGVSGAIGGTILVIYATNALLSRHVDSPPQTSPNSSNGSVTDRERGGDHGIIGAAPEHASSQEDVSALEADARHHQPVSTRTARARHHQEM